MNSKTYFWSPVGVLFFSVTFWAAINVYQNPSTTPKARSLGPLPEFKGPLSHNTILDEAEILFQDQVWGPESFASDDDGFIYTGLMNGSIVRFHKDEPRSSLEVFLDKVTCSGDPDQETRPFGVRVKHGSLYIADPLVGIIKVNLLTKIKKCVLDFYLDTDKRSKGFYNDLDIGSDGSIYYSEVSTKYTYDEYDADGLEAEPNGALFKYDPSTDEITTLIPRLYSANGVQLSKDEDFILVSEITAVRVTRYWLKGPKAGTRDVFCDNLPGFPDNIRATVNGTHFWVGMYTSRFAPFAVFDFLLPHPWVRYLIVKLVNPTMLSVFKGSRPVGLAILLSPDGEIISSYQSHEVFSAVTEANEVDGYLYIGGYETHNVARVRL